MLSFERLDVLRKQNKELLKKLKNQTEKLQSLTAACPYKEVKNPTSRSAVDARHGVSFTDAVVTVAVGGSRPKVARDALCKPTRTKAKTKTAGKKPVHLTSEGCEPSTPTEHITSQISPLEDTTFSSDLQGKGTSHSKEKLIGMEHISPVPVSVPLDRDRKVTFQCPGQDPEAAYDRQFVPPLLGYDWIAGLLDAESSLTERSEQFFSELRSFRQVNKDECVHSASSGFPVALHLSSTPLGNDSNEQEPAASDSHQCTFCYRINSRLFAAPLDPQAACPICKMPKAKHPHTDKEPAFVRVSIPRSTLLPAYRYKAHRRCSFDPSDSIGLPSHCLSGWSNSTCKTSSQMSRLDLRSSVGLGPTA